MKRYGTIVGAVLLYGMIATGTSIEINGNFEHFDGAVPENWQINSAYRGGTITTVTAGTHGGRKALGVKSSATTNFALMSRHRQPVKVGEKYRITAAVKGKGAFQLGFYGYTAKEEWVGHNFLAAPERIASNDYRNVVFELEVPALAHETRGSLAQLVPVITVLPGSDLVVDDLTFSSLDAVSAASTAAPETNQAVQRATWRPVPQELQPSSHLAGADTPVRLLLPKVIYAVPGHEMNVYFANVIRVNNPEQYRFAVECTKGRMDGRRWRFIPKSEDVGHFPFKLKVYDDADQVVAEAGCTVMVSPASNGNNRALALLPIGDSLTDAAVYPRVLLELMRNDGAAHFRLVGSHAGSGRAATADFAIEGYGGWRWRSFCDHWTDGSDYRARSKFLVSGKDGVKLDLPNYFRIWCNGRAPEVITVFLGVNDIAGANETSLDALVAESLHYSEQLIAALKAAAPTALIGVALIPPPSASPAAFGRNYGTTIQHGQYRKNQHTLLGAMLRKYADDPRVSLIPTHLNLDCRYGYPREEEPVFAQSRESVSRGTNAVHPNDEGYAQIAESFYAWLKAHLR